MQTTEPISDEVWPLFPRTVDELPNLARYVSSASVRQLGLGLGDSFMRRTRHGEDGVTGIARENHETARQLFDAVRLRRYPYAREPVSFDERFQWIRPPAELDQFAGTCVDFAVLYASLCLTEEVAPILVVRIDQQASHVMVLLDLERTGDLDKPLPSDFLTGVLTWTSASALADRLRVQPRFLLVDPSLASNTGLQSKTFSSATQRSLLSGPQDSRVALIDVARFHTEVSPPYLLPGPHERPAISRQIPNMNNFRSFGDKRQKVLNDLHHHRGMIGILGEQASGKSTLALQAAATTDPGFGWFLQASSTAALIESLGRAEARERYGSDENLSMAQLDELASQARLRLRDSNLPWFLVLDNANLGEDPYHDIAALLLQLPPLQIALDHRIIITSTNEAWRDYCRPIYLEPVPEGIHDFPPELGVQGRPLFVVAFEKLCTAVGQSPEDLVARLPPEVAGKSAEHVLWWLFRDIFGDSSLAVQMAKFAAWGPPDRIRAEALRETIPEPKDLFEILCSAGILQPVSANEARMHRLIGSAIRSAQRDDHPATQAESMERLAQSQIEVDSETEPLVEGRISQLLELAPPISYKAARALCLLATRIEKFLGAKPSNALFQRALPALSEKDIFWRAECLHSEARHRFQSKKSEADLREGLKMILGCLSLRDEVISAPEEQKGASGPTTRELEVYRWRSVALQGLIEVAIGARILRDRGDESASRIAEAESFVTTGRLRVQESLKARQDILQDPLDEDILRGQFNIANIEVNLGQFEIDPSLRSELFASAYKNYQIVGEARETMRPQAPTPHIASCYAGMALVEYLRAIDTSRTQTRDRRGASHNIRQASELLQKAMNHRERIEDVDGDEIEKTARLEVKIALLRWSGLALQKENMKNVDGLLREIKDEIPELTAKWWPK